MTSWTYWTPYSDTDKCDRKNTKTFIICPNSTTSPCQESSRFSENGRICCLYRYLTPRAATLSSGHWYSTSQDKWRCDLPSPGSYRKASRSSIQHPAAGMPGNLNSTHKEKKLPKIIESNRMLNTSSGHCCIIPTLIPYREIRVWWEHH